MAPSNILALPDEILLFVFKQLNVINAFDSLVDVNKRFHRLVLDPLHIRHLDLTDPLIVGFLRHEASSIDAGLLGRISRQVLPRIAHQVYHLTCEGSSLNEVLGAGSYSQLSSLSPLNCEQDLLYESLTGDATLRDLTGQLTRLKIQLRPQSMENFVHITTARIFASILSLCKELSELSFDNPILDCKCSILLLGLPLDNYVPSTLTKLRIDLYNIADCIFLLDGRFPCLSTVVVKVNEIFPVALNIQAIKPMLKLKSFSLTSLARTWAYDDLVVPFLRRMVNLEELRLYLLVERSKSSYLTGNELHRQFLVYMTQPKKFTFNIQTHVDNSAVVELPSNEEIQRSFTGECYQERQTYVRIDAKQTGGACHVYSVPYDFEYFIDLNNSFQGGTFDQVRQLTMRDERPFEQKLLRLICQSFPLLQSLRINNYRPQTKMKQDLSTPIAFPHLTFLHLKEAHIDYVELFLLKGNAHLPRLLNLCMKYSALRSLTNNFTDTAAQFNFSTLKILDIRPSSVRPEVLQQYFPFL